jgi:hypothetical protein
VVPPGSQLIWSPAPEAGLTELIGTARPGTTIPIVIWSRMLAAAR